MKQLIKSFILVLTTLVTLTACGSDEPQPEPAPSPTPDPGKVIDATAISFAITEEVLSPGETYQLKPTTTPENATISYTSSNTDVATVDDKGVVTAKQVGETEIMATSGKERARFNLYVQNDDKINLEIVENLGGKATIKVTPLVDKPYFIWLMPKGQLEDPINGGLKWVWLKFDRAFWIWCQDNTGTPWQEFAKTFSNRGEMTYITDDESLGSNRISLLQWMLDYVVYAYYMDDNGMATSKLSSVVLTPKKATPSSNQFTISDIKRSKTDKTVTFTINTTNDDPYLIHVDKSTFFDFYTERTEPLDNMPWITPIDYLQWDIADLYMQSGEPLLHGTQTFTRSVKSNFNDYKIYVQGFSEAGATTDYLLSDPIAVPEE